MDSYIRHRHEEQALADYDDVPWRYRSPNSIGNWHHDRMLRSIEPLLKHCRETRWMTVGDGRFGSDANFLKPYVRSVTATSISGSTLQIAKSRGWIEDFSEENAEALSFADNSFDYVLCKETYHHFPRPAIGFYEMLRVARRGIVLVEPMEGAWSPLLLLKRALKRMLRRDHSYDQFEPSGNFIFRVNINEIAKMMTALGHTTLAWKGMNTFWHAPFDAQEKNRLSVAWIGSSLGILAQDVACALRLLTPGLATVICFKATPAPDLIGDLRSNGFHIRTLPLNPYT